MDRFDPARTGFNDREHELGVRNVGRLEPLAACPAAYIPYGTPSVVGREAYFGSFTQTGGFARSRLIATPCGLGPGPEWVETAVDVDPFDAPAAANGVVYASAGYDGLAAFDATSGSVLWQGLPTSGGFPDAVAGGPAVRAGVVYAATFTGVAAFDAAGEVGCSGTPRTCRPLWTAATGGEASAPAVADGVVFAGSRDGSLWAFDAAGRHGCSGSPVTCQPLWVAAPGGIVSSVAVAGGVAFVTSDDGGLAGTGWLSAFDAAGRRGCSGTPRTCAPLWRASVGTAFSSPAVVKGTVYVGGGDGNLYAFDAAGRSGCTRSTHICSPLWSAPTGGAVSAPAVAGGLVFVGSRFGNLFAFDAAGRVGCTRPPGTCAPLWTAPTGGFGAPVVANGHVYQFGAEGDPTKLLVFGLPS